MIIHLKRLKVVRKDRKMKVSNLMSMFMPQSSKEIEVCIKDSLIISISALTSTKLNIFLNCNEAGDCYLMFPSGLLYLKKGKSKVKTLVEGYKYILYYEVVNDQRSLSKVKLKKDVKLFNTISENTDEIEVVNYKDKNVYLDHLNKTISLLHPNIRKINIIRKLKLLRKRSNLLAKPRLHLEINRKNILNSSLIRIVRNFTDLTIENIKVEFTNEMGQDDGAIRREWINLVFNEFKELKFQNEPFLVEKDGIFDVNDKLNIESSFFSNEQTSLFTIKEMIKDLTCNEQKFSFLLGYMIGLALYLGEEIGINLSLAFYENLLKRIYTIDHIQDVILQKNYDLHKDDLENFDLNEDYLFDRLFKTKEGSYNLIRVGFISSIYNLVILKGKEHVSLYSYICKEFTAFDFVRLFNSNEKITIETLKSVVRFQYWAKKEKEIGWFWEILGEFSDSFLRKLLLFGTGSNYISKYGNSNKLQISFVNTKNGLISASACVNKIYLGHYDSKDIMREKIIYSIEECEGFHKI
ncbi:SMUF2 [Hepatospora eriocheir]|uniref:HECT-type E3 ubiquitin transferase n=1 Tax=Hepatospora eriocheir TaxID=1081669 RepID=A0A1X0QIB4_9MICR|nr:SMUF2 [Hepatospora eriocheir]